jgi:hypothetical protein
VHADPTDVVAVAAIDIVRWELEALFRVNLTAKKEIQLVGGASLSPRCWRTVLVWSA